MDGSENESPKWLSIPGFPSMFLFKPDAKKKPVLYDGQPNIMGVRNRRFDDI